MTLFERNHVVGVFRGFSEGGMEFHADIVMPYRDEFQSIPMHGQFVLVQLEHEHEAVFGRITSIASQGRLTSPIGEDYAVRAVRDQRPIPDELRDQYLKYKVDIRVLGVLREEAAKLIFVPSHRRLPHVGAQVAFLTPELLAEVANANDKAEDAAEIGFLAFGEFIYSGGDPRAPMEPWMVTMSPAIIPRFQISKLVSRRSFVFARAGFGKSNLVKLLFSKLYATDPTVGRRNGIRVPVGTVIFDPDGEYFWPDPHGRPGLCDVADLTDRLVVFTNRKAPSRAYASFVVDGVKLDIRQLPAARVIGLALTPEKQDQQNVVKLKGLSVDKWRDLVDMIYEDRYDADPRRVAKLLGTKEKDGEDVQVTAAIANMVRVVRELHDPSSQLLRALKAALADGKLCVVDISQMRGPQGLQWPASSSATSSSTTKNSSPKPNHAPFPLLPWSKKLNQFLGHRVAARMVRSSPGSRKAESTTSVRSLSRSSRAAFPPNSSVKVTTSSSSIFSPKAILLHSNALMRIFPAIYWLRCSTNPSWATACSGLAHLELTSMPSPIRCRCACSTSTKPTSCSMPLMGGLRSTIMPRN